MLKNSEKLTWLLAGMFSLSIGSLVFSIGMILTLDCESIEEKPSEDTRALMMAIMGVESSFNRNKADGLAGEVGPFQIKECVVDDVYNFLGRNYSYDDRKDIETAWRIATDYMDLWATKERLGREPTIQDRARIFHGGPNGWRKPSTVAWWNDVDNYYIKLKIQ